MTDVPLRSGHAGRDPDAYAALEEQRDFLLRSLDDLEAEHDAGDISEDDYVALKDDYTARAAAVLRALDEGAAGLAAAKRPWSWRLAGVVTAAVLVLGVGAGVLVARSSGSRTGSGSSTGDATLDLRDTLAQAGQKLAAGEVLDAVMLYDDVLAEDPENVEALTYRGWALVLATLVSDGLPYLQQAVEIDPTYPDAHVFLAITYARQGRLEAAQRQLDALDGADIPPEMQGEIDALQQQIDAAVSPIPPTTQG